MATIKSFTSLEQSKVLAKILPIESADMYFEPSAGFCTEPSEVKVGDIKYAHPRSVPCWSLTALLNYLREVDYFPEINADEFEVTMQIDYYNENEARPLAPVHNIKIKAESFIDACCEMVITLYEQKLL